MGGKSARRKRLFEENPICIYCGIQTVLTDGFGGQMPNNGATVEHLFPRLHPHRKSENYGNERRLAIACYKCNNEKSVRDQTDYLGVEGAKLRSMGAQNKKGWLESRLKDINTFDCF